MKFKRLIKKHSKTYQINHKTGGHWDGPNWVKGLKTNYEVDAAIFLVTAEEVQRYEGLGYTKQGIKIFVLTPVEAFNLDTQAEEIIELKKNDEITYLGNDYIFNSVNDRTTHADFSKWIAVRKQGDSL